jgi:hypothetical protein
MQKVTTIIMKAEKQERSLIEKKITSQHDYKFVIILSSNKISDESTKRKCTSNDIKIVQPNL